MHFGTNCLQWVLLRTFCSGISVSVLLLLISGSAFARYQTTTRNTPTIRTTGGYTAHIDPRWGRAYCNYIGYPQFISQSSGNRQTVGLCAPTNANGRSWRCYGGGYPAVTNRVITRLTCARGEQRAAQRNPRGSNNNRGRVTFNYRVNFGGNAARARRDSRYRVPRIYGNGRTALNRKCRQRGKRGKNGSFKLESRARFQGSIAHVRGSGECI